MELDGYFAILIKAGRSFDALNQNVLQFVHKTSNSLRFIYIIDFVDKNWIYIGIEKILWSVNRITIGKCCLPFFADELCSVTLYL